MKMIELHVLQNFSPANLNRDDTGAPKDAIFGGYRRARVSSQCWKRATRLYFSANAAALNLSPEDIAVRTKRVQGEIVKQIIALNPQRNRDEAATKVAAALAGIKLTVKDDNKTEALLFISRRDIQAIATLVNVNTNWDRITGAVNTEPPAENTESPAPNKNKKNKKKDAAAALDPEVKDAMENIIVNSRAIDIALFGRMLADMPESNQNAACQVAHAISTHTVDREFDYFTAVDDLRPEDTAGADMIGTVEFNSACFYRYALLDADKLQENLGDDAALTGNAINAFVKAFIVAEPTGKQNTFAAHNPAQFVAVTVRNSGAPYNLANAFEKPVDIKRYDETAPKNNAETLTERSARKLVDYAQKLRGAYGDDGKTFFLNLTETKVADGFGNSVASLDALLKAIGNG